MSDGIPFTASREELECLAVVHATTRARDETDFGWRHGMLFDFTDCPHTSMSYHEIETDLGTWIVEICLRCGQQVSRGCTCGKSVWMADGQVLLCLNCGSDGT